MSRKLRSSTVSVATFVCLAVSSPNARAQTVPQVIVVEPPLVCGENQVKVVDRYCIDRQPRKAKPASYLAVVWTLDATDVWAAWNYPDGYEAEAAAGVACRTETGSTCTVATSFANGTAVVARTPSGNLLQAGGTTPEKARAQMAKLCSQKAERCEIIHEFTARMPKSGEPEPEHYFPGQSAIRPDRLRFAVAAWTFSRKAPWGAKVWVAGGQLTQAAAEKAAKKQCEAETLWSCQTSDSVADNGYLLVFRVGNDGVFAQAGTDKDDLQRRAVARCQEHGWTCSTGVLVDSRERGLKSIDTKTLH